MILRNKPLIMDNRSCRNQTVGNQRTVTQKILLYQINRTVRNLVGNFQDLIPIQELFEVAQLFFVSTADNQF